jgi:hypothetical protein
LLGPRYDRVEQFPSCARVTLAGIGRLPDTVEDRAVVVDMRRGRSEEAVGRCRRREFEAAVAAQRERLPTWVVERAAELGDSLPAMSAGLTDRQEDIWEALLAIADQAAGSRGSSEPAMRR